MQTSHPDEKNEKKYPSTAKGGTRILFPTCFQTAKSLERLADLNKDIHFAVENLRTYGERPDE
jgi:hypothetical protein